MSFCFFPFISMNVFLFKVATHASVPSFDNCGGALDKDVQLMSEDGSIVRPSADKISSTM